jgi:superfamily II DNA/RNA helicase
MVLSIIEVVALLLSLTSVALVLFLGVYGWRRLRRMEARGWQGGLGGEGTTRVFDLDVEEGLGSDAKAVRSGRTGRSGRTRREDSVRLDRVGRREVDCAGGPAPV